jgi:hypothetical protein
MRTDSHSHVEGGYSAAAPLGHALSAQVRPIWTDGETPLRKLGRLGGALVLQGLQLHAACWAGAGAEIKFPLR